MKTFLQSALIFLFLFSQGWTYEIHTEHCFFGCPTGTPQSNDLIVRDIYTLSSNDTSKFADWVAYRIEPWMFTCNNKTSRVWKADPDLDEEETLEPEDYSGASKVLKFDRGHQAPLTNFKCTDSWDKTNYLSNITPQKYDLNRGPWKILEDRERDIARESGKVWVMTGPLYERPMPKLPKANESHIVPSGYWKIIIVRNGEELDIFSFIFDQNTPKTDKIESHTVTIDEIEERSGLDFKGVNQ